MEIITSPSQMTAWSNDQRAAKLSLAFVPTMGFLHDGHCALMRSARSRADRLVVSLFVNPIQFGPGEDYARYPRDLERDQRLAAAQGADVLFVPAVGDMYAADEKTRITVMGVSDGLCGAHRPGHFDGVATVVAKLFNIVKPSMAVFGEKDFQQLAVIRRMVKDLNFDIEVVGHPIVREPDGLAMSSRNVYLSADERRQALCLSRAIAQAKNLVLSGRRDAAELIVDLTQYMTADFGVTPEYVSIVGRHDLKEQKNIDPDSMVLLAVRIGRTRLIDNSSLMVERVIPISNQR